MMMARYLKEQQISEFRDCFNLYDKKRNGRISCKDLMSVMRSLGTCPTKQDIQKHLKTLGKDRTEYMDFSQFLSVMHRQMSNENVSQEIFKAFQMTDEMQSGTIPASQLRHLLMNTGETLSAKEVDLMFRKGNISNRGPVKYKDFVALITSPIEEI